LPLCAFPLTPSLPTPRSSDLSKIASLYRHALHASQSLSQAPLPASHRNHFRKSWPTKLALEKMALAWYFGLSFPHPLEHLKERRSEEHTSELQSRVELVCRLL